MTNSANMTMAERLAQQIKESPLGALMSEDDVTEVSRKAIDLAFFQPRAVGSYGDKKPPLVIEWAEAAFRAEIATRAKVVVDQVVADPKFVEALQKAAIGILPAVMMNLARDVAMKAALTGAQAAIADATNAFAINMKGGYPASPQPHPPAPDIGPDVPNGLEPQR